MIDEIITGNNASAASYPGASSVDVLTSGKNESPGTLVIEYKTSSMAEFEPLLTIPINTKAVMATPDSNIEYRFRGINLQDSVRVYMGP